MKKIGLISDTHGHLDDRIHHHLENCDEVWHAGDIGGIKTWEELESRYVLRAVYGNIDDAKIRRCCPLEQEFELEGVKIYMIHIGGYPGRYSRNLYIKLKHTRPDIFICGHSHILKIIWDKNLNLLHLNPGASGTHGFHAIRTLVRFNLNNGKVQDTEVVELGKRGVIANDPLI